jgi:hypothetical protein
MAKKDIAGTAQGANPAVKQFSFEVSKVTEASLSGEFCHSLILRGAAQKTILGTMSRVTFYSFFSAEPMEVGSVLTVSGNTIDSAWAAEGIVVDTIIKDGSTFKRLSLMPEE